MCAVINIKNTTDNSLTSFIDGDWIESDVITTEGIRYLTTGNIGSGYYKEQGEGFITEETFKNLHCTEVFPGDILISRLNEPIGRCCLIPNLNYRIITAVDNVIYRPKNNIVKEFIVYFMNSKLYSDYTSSIARGSTMHRISRSMLAKIKICVPPKEEQILITNFLNDKCTPLNEEIKNLINKISLLRERKQIIINDVVTGKVKVS